MPIHEQTREQYLKIATLSGPCIPQQLLSASSQVQKSFIRLQLSVQMIDMLKSLCMAVYRIAEKIGMQACGAQGKRGSRLCQMCSAAIAKSSMLEFRSN